MAAPPSPQSFLAALGICGALTLASYGEPGDAPPSPGLPEAIDPVVTAILPKVGDYRRAALHVDPIESSLARAPWRPATPGGSVTAANGAEVHWLPPDAPRTPELAGGYLSAKFDSPSEGVMLLDAPGCAAVWIDGEWVPGDPYGVGWFQLPVHVNAGENLLVAHLASPAAMPRLVRPSAPLTLVTEAAVVPDLVAGGPSNPSTTSAELVVSVPIRNATDQPLIEHRLRWNWDGEAPTVVPLRRVEARHLTPAVVRVAPPRTAPVEGSPRTLRVEVLGPAADVSLAEAALRVRVVSPRTARVRTFESAVDGSAQAYSVLPSADSAPNAAVVVALHDAGEAHERCLARYKQTPGAHVLAPGGRGRWGFDWEDWSARDALEALDDFLAASRRAGVPADERRVSVLGEGMGGHGALRLATLAPERFAAIGFVDGWISFYTQGGALAPPRDADPLARLLARQASASDPLRIVENLRGVGVLVHVGGRSSADPTEARFLRERLGEFHSDFVYREGPQTLIEGDAGERVAWLTARRSVTDDADAEVDFATHDPGLSASRGGVTIVAADRQGEVARVRLRRDLAAGVVRGATDNVRRLEVSLAAFPDTRPVTVELDGAPPVTVRPGRGAEVLSLARDREGEWRRTPAGPVVPGLFKSPARGAGFKAVFAARPQLVYGTRGTDDERRWAIAKARYDAHLFFYRGAGLLEVLPDTELRSPLREGAGPRRSLVLYGSAATNAAWIAVDQESFFRRSRILRVSAGGVLLGERPESGDDLAVVAIRPRLGDDTASIGVVGGSGVIGMRLTTRLRYFWSGVEYPDYLLYGPEALDAPARQGQAHDVRAAGYFDPDWGLDERGVIWRDVAL